MGDTEETSTESWHNKSYKELIQKFVLGNKSKT